MARNVLSLKNELPRKLKKSSTNDNNHRRDFLSC